MQVFISYSRDDRATVETLRADLEAMGLDPWLDEELSGGQRWWNEILDRIADCDLFVAALSEASLTSEACLSEATYALGMNRPILPIRIAEVDPAIAPRPLSDFQWIDYIAHDRHELLILFKSLFGVKKAPRPPARPEPPPVPGSYLNELRTEISAPEMPYERQAALLHQIRQRLKAGKDRPALLTLASSLRHRPETLASIADELDELLQTTGPSPADGPPPEPSQPPGPSGAPGPPKPQPRPAARPDAAPRATRADDRLTHHQQDAPYTVHRALQRFKATGFSDLFIAPDIPEHKLANARKAARVPENETIHALINCTVFGGAKDSILFGNRALYARNITPTPTVAVAPYADIDLKEMSTDSNMVDLGFVRLSRAGSNVSSETVAAMIAAVVRALRESD